jgi:hypothetical protein
MPSRRVFDREDGFVPKVLGKKSATRALKVRSTVVKQVQNSRAVWFELVDIASRHHDHGDKRPPTLFHSGISDWAGLLDAALTLALIHVMKAANDE